MATVESGQRVRKVNRDPESGDKLDPVEDPVRIWNIIGTENGNLAILVAETGETRVPSVVVGIVPTGTVRDEYEDAEEEPEAPEPDREEE